MRMLVNFAIVATVGGLYGYSVSLILDPPIGQIVALLGGLAIGWYGMKALDALTKSSDQLH